MTESTRPARNSIVWGTLALTALACLGLGLVVLAAEEALTPTAIALVVGVAPAVVSVPLLLGQEAPSEGLLATGRVLMWLQAFAILVASVLAIVALVTG